jgi:hypothetical protein
MVLDKVPDLHHKTDVMLPAEMVSVKEQLLAMLKLLELELEQDRQLQVVEVL